MGYEIRLIPTPSGWTAEVYEIVAGRWPGSARTSFTDDGHLNIIDSLLAKASAWVKEQAAERYGYV